MEIFIELLHVVCSISISITCSLIFLPFFKLQFFRTKGKMALFPSKVFCQYTYFKSLTHKKNECKFLQSYALKLFSFSLVEIVRLSSNNFLFRFTLAVTEDTVLSYMCIFFIFLMKFWLSFLSSLLSNLMIGSNNIPKTFISLNADYSIQ